MVDVETRGGTEADSSCTVSLLVLLTDFGDGYHVQCCGVGGCGIVASADVGRTVLLLCGYGEVGCGVGFAERLHQDACF